MPKTLATALTILCLTGCAKNESFTWFGLTDGPREKMVIAVSDEDPDTRRTAVADVAESRSVSEPWAIDGFVAIATLDRDAQARCVALRALGRCGSPRGVDACLMVLNHTAYPPTDVRPPADVCRWDAAAALAELAATPAAFGPEQQKATEPVAVAKLEQDPEEHVRIHAADVLGYIPTPTSVDALIGGLRDRNFAVVSACENALVRLTGETHECDPYLWVHWRDENRQNLFAKAGQIPDSRRQPYDNRFEKAVYDTRQTVRWIFPGPKQKNYAGRSD